MPHLISSKKYFHVLQLFSSLCFILSFFPKKFKYCNKKSEKKIKKKKTWHFRYFVSVLPGVNGPSRPLSPFFAPPIFKPPLSLCPGKCLHLQLYVRRSKKGEKSTYYLLLLLGSPLCFRKCASFRVSQKNMKIQKFDLHWAFFGCLMIQVVCAWQNWPDLQVLPYPKDFLFCTGDHKIKAFHTKLGSTLE